LKYGKLSAQYPGEFPTFQQDNYNNKQKNFTFERS